MVKIIYLKIADIPIRITPSSKNWHDFLNKKFFSFIQANSYSQFKFEVINNNLINKSFKYSVNKDRLVKIYTPYSLKLFKKFNDYLKIAFGEVFLQKNGFLLHASSLVKNGAGYLFLGKHGTGKSTIIKMVKNKLVYKSFNDDYAIIRKINNDFILYSSPFLEKNKIEISNDSAKISRIFFLKQAQFNKIEELDIRTAYQHLLGNLLTVQVIKGLKRKYSKKYLNSLMNLAYSFAKSVDAYRLYFTKSIDFIKFLK